MKGSAVAFFSVNPRYSVNLMSVKVMFHRGYGAELTFCENSPTSRKETCQKIADATGRTIIHPYDNEHVIAGQVCSQSLK